MQLPLTIFKLLLGFHYAIGIPTWRERTYIDLTHELNEEVMYFPKALHFKDTNVYSGENAVKVWQNVNNFCGSEHSGTHVDAPKHVYPNGKTIEKMDIENFIGTGIVIDITEKVKDNVNAEPSVEDLTNWEQKCNKKIPDGAIVLLRTGYEKHWGNRTAFLGTTTYDDPLSLNFPGFGKTSIEWLLENRNIKAVGSEIVSFDKGNDPYLTAHQLILGKGLYGIENIANMHKLPECGSRIYVLPIKIKGGTAGLVRMIAEIEPEQTSWFSYFFQC